MEDLAINLGVVAGRLSKSVICMDILVFHECTGTCMCAFKQTLDLTLIK